ncbi:MAG: TetM/TetW/TetO/TetS family tetracycline resistance ribosomal protection protein [Lachnospiraceae bacterium]|nr:TetM/TetW/TetO/TetS family tetracycline resistance ribosomal protection protein [Lachnospiraceae bacterium]
MISGILAHVDAGKTTLSEGILYTAGASRSLGRVDHGDTTMDSHDLERSRGITIFTGEAAFSYGGRQWFLLDTPGHVDFSAEMERTLSVLDVCILVLSGSAGVQPHTRTLWRLLSLYEIPTFIFVTKMDYARYTESELMGKITEELSDACVSFSGDRETRDDLIAMTDEEAMREYLAEGQVSDAVIRDMIKRRVLFPVYFGSGLRLTGIKEFLDGLNTYTEEPLYPERFSARVYKITHDDDGNPIAHLKVTGGVLKPRASLTINGAEAKVSQLRRYTGARYTPVDSASKGELVAAAGLPGLSAGSLLNAEGAVNPPVLEPCMRYSILLPEGVSPLEALPKFRELEKEDPSLHLTWNSYLKEIQAGLMGEVQAEVLKSLIMERFGISVEIGRGHVLYKETVRGVSEGVGHYEPLRHYAEVHVLLRPLPRGSGLKFDSEVSTDELDRNWQNLILTHLQEKEHLGVLTGSPLTDTRITLVAGAASLKHTEGGDFRQATYRAVRNGLMNVESVLLEPYYRFRLDLPGTVVSRAMNDIRAMHGTFIPPIYGEKYTVLSGRAPVTGLMHYAREVAAYSSGEGRLLLEADGYDLCHNPEEVIREFCYRPEEDLENSPDSVFCAHGAGFFVRWSDVRKYMHLASSLTEKEIPEAPVRQAASSRRPATDKELEALLEKEFGPIRRRQYGTAAETRTYGDTKVPEEKKKVLIVDGYNVIFAWEDLRELSETDIEAARNRLAHLLANYSAFTGAECTLVFDGYRVPGNRGEQYDMDGVRIVFTKERETGDLYIERMIQGLPKGTEARVVTSDGIIQLSALRKGVLRMSSQEFEREMDEADNAISDLLRRERRTGHETIGEILKKELDRLKASGESKEGKKDGS